MTTSIDIAVDRLVWHECTQSSKLEPMVEAALRGAEFPPIDVIAAGSKFMIIDGAHRARAAQAGGHSHIRAVVHDLPRRVAVPGWSHMISEGTARQLAKQHPAPAGQQGVADVLLDEQLVYLGPEAPTRGAQHLAFHAIGLHLEEELEAAEEGTVLFTWHPPQLDVLVDLALASIPLPHTVTRFSPLLVRWGAQAATPRVLVGAAAGL